MSTPDPHANGHAGQEGAGDRGTEPPAVAGTLDTPQAHELAALGQVFGDLQYTLLCCENLVAVLAQPQRGPAEDALIEALWTGALVGYARCFSPRTEVLTDEDVSGLELEGEVGEFHDAVKKLRDHYVSRHVNPRETLTVGVVLEGSASAQQRAAGIAVLADPRPSVDDMTVRMLGRIAYALSTKVDERIGTLQAEVMAAAAALPGAELSRLPQVQLPASGAAGS